MNSISFKPFTMLALLAMTASACSSDEGGGGTFDNLGGSSGANKGGSSNSTGHGGSTGIGLGGSSSTSKGGSTSSSSGGYTSSTAGQASACMGVPADLQQQESCTGIEQEAERIPIDMFIMMDRSCSMNYCLGTSGENCSVIPDCSASGGSRWDAIRAGLVDFVEKVKGQDVRAGIGFFGASGVGEDSLDCDVTQYSTPKVPIGAIATTGPQIVDAIDSTPPAGFTPTYPALDGALRYAKSWAMKNPGRRTVVVLVTDGYPTQCSPTTISGIAELAKAGYTTSPPVRTYVVGLAAGFNLDQIAQQGGTNAAFNFDKSNVTSDNLVNTLMNISDSKIACNYEIPPAPTGMVFNPDKVQVLYTPAAGMKQELPKLDNISACDRNPNGGWYYDNPADPKVINVCPCSCANLQAGTVQVSVGCDPYIGIK
ncbi:MAG TPA: vWA domain-containing protein [Polyangiaceae bacterium]|nr:vWA domain-containing protein [Polyangiaceae bacterium]